MDRLCIFCRSYKSDSFFSKKPKGKSAVCKICEENKQKIISQKVFVADGKKLCAFCLDVKNKSDFSKRKASKDGLNNKCRYCNKIYLSEYRKNNPDSFKNYYAKNTEKLSLNYKKWREKNKEKRKEYNSEYLNKNRSRVNFRIARRNALKLKATPKWANEERILRIYQMAENMREIFSLPYEVDHYYPLQGKKVCGLHVETNLRIISKDENIRKRNKMPEDFYA